MVTSTLKNLKVSLRTLLVFSVLTGVIYPLMVTGVATAIFPHQASGSLVLKSDKVVGSDLIAQKFTSPRYFYARPSAADYGTIPSGASNLGPTSASLRQAIDERMKTLGAQAPADLLTTSASGLDPHITPEAAHYQIERITHARALTAIQAQRIQEIIVAATEGPQLGFLGKNRVNVLRLNLELDRVFP